MTVHAPPTWTPDPAERPDFRNYTEIVTADRHPAPAYLLERHAAEVDSYTVDADRYTSPRFHELEGERLWPRIWQWACRENDVPKVGDYIEYEILDSSVLIVRSTPSEIRAFRNACRHRATAVATGSGSTSCFSCPFHGWTYDLSGALSYLPADWDFPHVDKSKFGLRAVRCETFDGMVFINLDDGAPPLADFLGETISSHLLACPDAAKHKLYHFERVVDSNWKAFREAFAEGYHVPRTHPELIPCSGDVQREYDSFGLHSRVLSPVGVPSILAGVEFTEDEILEVQLQVFQNAGAVDCEVPEGSTAAQVLADMKRAAAEAQGWDVSRYSDTELRDNIIYHIFPNLVLFRSPGGALIMRFRPYGHDPNRSLVDAVLLLPVPPDASSRPRDTAPHRMPAGASFEGYEPTRDVMGSLARVLDQDTGNAPLVQKGLQVSETVVFARAQEGNIVAHHRNLDAWMGVGRDWRS
jgi:nitrite reductase/ring-hydroxylating ferredoxin subunit